MFAKYSKFRLPKINRTLTLSNLSSSQPFFTNCCHSYRAGLILFRNAYCFVWFVNRRMIEHNRSWKTGTTVVENSVAEPVPPGNTAANSDRPEHSIYWLLNGCGFRGLTFGNQTWPQYNI